MQTLRFYTQRIFAVVCLIFFGFLLLIASKSNSIEEESNSREIWNRQQQQGIAPLREKFVRPPVQPPFQNDPLYAQPMANPYGAQLDFQRQPGPDLNAIVPSYKDLGFNRKVDTQLLDRIQHHVQNLDLRKLAAKECTINTTLQEYWKSTQSRDVPIRDTWESWYATIGTCDLYRDERLLQNLLDDLSKLPIKHVETMEGGTQVKLILTFDNDKQAVFKPMRFGRDYETDPNHFYFGDFERHTAEIATFHLDKILGFRRAVPTVGRVMNITKDLRDHADRKLKKTFFISPAKNQCFVSKCDYYCDTTHAICGSPDLKEGSVQVFLPDDTSVPRKHNKSPYRRTYSKKTQLAIWQQDMQFCTWKVKKLKTYAHGRRLLDLVDLHIMDYLIGNQDRHHYETLNVFGNIPAYAIHLDNGRAFGKTYFDDDDILLPLRQCCVIRPSTFDALLNFYKGPKSLTETLHESLAKDPIAPVLAYKHYPALERRLHKIMEYILECFDKRPGGAEGVVMVEYHNRLVAEPENAAINVEEEESEEETEQDKKPDEKKTSPPQTAKGDNNDNKEIKA